MLFKISIPKNLAKFTGKKPVLPKLYQKEQVFSYKYCEIFKNNFIKKRPQHRCFPMNIEKFLSFYILF